MLLQFIVLYKQGDALSHLQLFRPMFMTWICYEKIYKARGKNTEIFIKAMKDIGLEVISEKTKYMITTRHQNVVQNQNIVIGN